MTFQEISMAMSSNVTEEDTFLRTIFHFLTYAYHVILKDSFCKPLGVPNLTDLAFFQHCSKGGEGRVDHLQRELQNFILINFLLLQETITTSLNVSSNEKHCQRHNKPMGWVHITSCTQILIKFHISESRSGINFKISNISTKVKLENIGQT